MAVHIHSGTFTLSFGYDRSYKELMARCNELGLGESRALRKSEKTAEQLKRLKVDFSFRRVPVHSGCIISRINRGVLVSCTIL